MAIYIFAVIYLTFRKDSAVTFMDTTMNDSEIEMENGAVNPSRPHDNIPYREDLSDIPLPK